MRHLCTPCSAMKVGKGNFANMRVVESPGFAMTVEYLADSARGILTGKPCHFCALVLRSLKDHHYLGTSEEDSRLPKGLVTLCLSDLYEEDYYLIANCESFSGNPIKLSLGADESCRGSDCSSSASSDQVFSQIQSWCNDCVTRHPRCSIARSSVSWLPSRVVDIGPASGLLSPKILESRGEVGKYVTLTHRWTRLTRPSATTSENYEARKQSIDMSTLSLTFQDAFEATRKLGVRYLWIDALCIVQDSAEDWEREASNMRSIYEFAWLNMAVAGSETEEGRMFMERTPRISRPCKLPDTLLSSAISRFESPIYAYLSSQFYAKAVFEGFLTQRGWILQERILSPRTIYFAQEEVFWECSNITASETIPWGWNDKSPLVKFNSHDLALNTGSLLDDDTTRHQDSTKSPRKMRRISGGIRDNEALFTYWYRLVEAYTRKYLTKTEDRLPAIFGLAQALHKSGMPYKTFSECYQNGVWLFEPLSMLWYLEKSSETPGLQIAGNRSYSWGSWGQAATFLTSEIMFIDESQKIELPIIESLGGHPSAQVATIGLPDDSLRRISHRQGNISGIVQVQGQLDIGSLFLSLAKEIASLFFSLAKDIGGNHVEFSYVSAAEDETTCRLSYCNEGSRTAAVLIDIYSYELITWLKESSGTVWLLKLGVGKDRLHPTPKSRAPWLQSSDISSGNSPTRHYDVGLILIPSSADLAALKEVQEKLDIWNPPASKPEVIDPDFDPFDRSSTPPIADVDLKKWMQANERMQAYKLLGPHNTTFQRVGIYRARASTYSYYKEHSTTLLLA